MMDNYEYYTQDFKKVIEYIDIIDLGISLIDEIDYAYTDKEYVY